MKAYYIYLIGIILCIASCTRHSQEWDKLQDVETYIETNADSALVTLQNIQPENLANKEEKAKHALLLSIAMDKNYIDRSDFDVLQPAIDYYRNHGTATDKLRTFYYEGRIFTNQGNNASATICFNKAMNEGQQSEDILTKARTHFAQANIYNTLYKWDNYIEENKQAAALFKEAGLHNSYVNCLIRIINGYTLKKDKENAAQYIETCKSILDSVSIKRKNNFYIAQLDYTINYGTKAEITSVLNEYHNNIQQKEWDWLSMAQTYLVLDDYQQAYSCIQNYQPTPNIKQKTRYYAILSKLYSNLNLPEKALDAYRNYTTITNSIDLATYEQTTKFIEELHKFEIQTIKEREKTKLIVFLFIIIVFALLSICIGIRIRLITRTKQKEHLEVEKEKYRLQCLQIEEELVNLSRLLAQQHELSETTQQILADRVSLLNKFFATYIKSYGEPDCTINEEIEKLVTDKESFINSNRISFSGSHPKFIHYLKEKGLTEWEMNYCCLYTLGLNGKEIGTYIKMRSHYNQSSIIRDKLGIGEHDTNLGIYLRKLLKELSS